MCCDTGAEKWTTEGAAGGIVHAFHSAFWGNWQFEIESVDPTFDEGAGDITFSKGGFQEGHGGGFGEQPFFIEGVREALDAKGEWWVDAATDTLYILPNTTAAAENAATTLKASKTHEFCSENDDVCIKNEESFI